MRRILAGLAVAGALCARPAAADVSPVLQEFCSLVVGCGLTPPAGFCPAEASGGLPGVAYDNERCAEARELAARGPLPQDPDAFPLYRFLGKRYRVDYLVDGELPMSPERLAFLLEDLPLAAKLLSRLGKNEYTIEYLDEAHRRFRGTKAGTLSGEATRVAGSIGERWLAYFGTGRSHVGFWKLRGQSFARFRFAALPPPRRGLSYSLQVLVTPDNSFVNRLMSLGLFRGLVLGQIRQVIDDIDAASRRLAEKGEAALRGEWTADERARVGRFLALP
jgi:hypothetical protein